MDEKIVELMLDLILVVDLRVFKVGRSLLSFHVTLSIFWL